MTEDKSPSDQSQRCPRHWYQCTGFQRDILFSIASHQYYEYDPYGLSLREWLNNRYPKEVGRSRVYTNLDDLHERGLITREQLSDRKNAYRLSDTAWGCLAAHGRLVDMLELQTMMPAQVIRTE